MWQGWISLLIGVWLIFSGLFSGLQSPFNLVFFGLLILILGFFLLKGWEGIVNGILGIWLIIGGFFSGFITAQNFVVVGILISTISIIRIFHLHRGVETKHKTA